MPTPYERLNGPGPATGGAAPQPWLSRFAYAGPPRPPLVLPRSGGAIGGVCAGIAQHIGVSVTIVRVAFVVLVLMGPGPIVYGFMWVLVPSESAPEEKDTPSRLSGLAGRPWAGLVALGIFIGVVGLAFALQSAGVDVRAGLLVPLLFVAAGATVSWSMLDETRRNRWLGTSSGTRGFAWIRLGLGLSLAVVGLIVLGIGTQASLSTVRDVGVSTIAVLAGVGIILAPWGLRLWGDMRAEQVATARATERADIAAHLHDSVLQTLALIQRRSHDPATVARLARAQERELRSWLYGGPAGGAGTLASAVTEVAHEVEDFSGVPIELVVTGDRPIEPDGAALARALRESLLNATNHGRPPVTAYVEIGGAGVEAFVRDRGDGFDLDAVPEDRLGVRGSVIGRMERHGGTARVRRREDGTEVELRLPPLPAPDADDEETD